MPPLCQGLLIGFSIAAPVGPIGLLCIRRSITDGRSVGFVSGLGAATADAVYGAVAAAGLTALMQLLVAQQAWLQLFGGLFLAYLGVRTVTAPPATGAAQASTATALLPAYVSTFLLTLANPMTILSFVAIFAGVGVSAAGRGGTNPWWLVVGVFLGSAAWWLTLSTIAGWFGERMRPSWLRGIGIMAGLLLIGFGAWQVAAAVQSLR